MIGKIKKVTYFWSFFSGTNALKIELPPLIVRPPVLERPPGEGVETSAAGRSIKEFTVAKIFFNVHCFKVFSHYVLFHHTL